MMRQSLMALKSFMKYRRRRSNYLPLGSRVMLSVLQNIEQKELEKSGFFFCYGRIIGIKMGKCRKGKEERG